MKVTPERNERVAKMTSLYLRNLFFTILQPGIVAGIVPYYLRPIQQPEATENIILQTLAVIIGLIGLGIMLDCIRRFAVEGKGTLSPADPTKQLVIKGLYHYSRNPMYVGVMGILIGQALFWQSQTLWIYAAIIFTAFQLFIIFKEEPRLRRDFGAAYEAYCQKVKRWF